MVVAFYLFRQLDVMYELPHIVPARSTLHLHTHTHFLLYLYLIKKGALTLKFAYNKQNRAYILMQNFPLRVSGHAQSGFTLSLLCMLNSKEGETNIIQQLLLPCTKQLSTCGAH